MLVLPVPARSCCRQVSLSVPSMFSQRLKPPIVDGSVDGVELIEGVCEGVTAGVCDGVTAGVCDGETAGCCCSVVRGGWPGEVLGAVEGAVPGVWANAVAATARRVVVLSILSMRTPFNELWLLLLQAAYRAA